MHDAHMRTSLNMFLQNPIFGVGPKMFRYHCSEKRYQIKNPPNNKSNDLRCRHILTICLYKLWQKQELLGCFFIYQFFFIVIFQLIKDIIDRFN